MTTLDLNHLQAWVGSQTDTEATLTLDVAQRMAATLNRNPALLRTGEPLPPLWHWLYFHEAVQTADLGEEGHAKLGGFLPPIPLPRRMWAGGRLVFERPLPIGALASKQSVVEAVGAKQGRSGQLVFVTVKHVVRVDSETCLTEWQDLVYRAAVQPAAAQPGEAASSPKPAPDNAQWSETVIPDPITLFRYSALTFNSHRIHYDVDYCRQVEGYPGLIVHGPLTATLLVDLLTRHTPGKTLREFQFRAVSPLFVGQPIYFSGQRSNDAVEVWAANAASSLAMSARGRLG
jgi:3-methylfumaryl-CoA hydratase